MDYISKSKSKTKDKARTAPTFEEKSSLKVLSSATLEKIAGASPADHIPMWSGANPPRTWDSADNDILTILQKLYPCDAPQVMRWNCPKLFP